MIFSSFHNKTRKAAVSGRFYAGNKSDLKKQLGELFREAEKHQNAIVRNPDALQAIISPHAGYMFSGEVAAAAFLQLPEKPRYKRVFVLASSHRFHFNGASVYCTGNYETPLGEIEVDCNLGKKLVEKSRVFQNKPEVHNEEHSLEVQLPFLQYKLGTDFLLVPILIGSNDEGTCKKIAEELKPFFTPENLFVISTDFSHFPEYDDALHLDKSTAQAVCRNVPEELLCVLDENKQKNIPDLSTSLCGWTSVLTLLHLTAGKNFEYEKILYRNSGDAKKYGDKNRVVGYWAMAVWRENSMLSVSEEEKVEILKKARHSIQSYLETGKKPKVPKASAGGLFNEKIGLFVSVYVNRELRGCIGNFAGDQTLLELLYKIPVSSICDRRFEPLKKEELEHLELEISVLSPLKKIHSPEQIELGRHGIYIRENFSSGTFLPQVATKTGWTVEQFLGHCSRDKAGLGWEGWKSAEVFIYEALVFRG